MYVKVSLGYDINDLLLIEDIVPENRRFRSVWGKYLFVNSELHAWLLEHNVNYDLGFTLNSYFSLYEWYIVFDTNADAVLFKLTWC